MSMGVNRARLCGRKKRWLNVRLEYKTSLDLIDYNNTAINLSVELLIS